MKKLAYIELDTHSEIMTNFMALMEGSERFRVDYYISPKINKIIDKASERIIVTDAYSIFSELLKKSYDLVIIGTAHRYFNTFSRISKAFPTAIIVHNLNFSKATKGELFKNVFKKDTLYRLKLLLKEGLLSSPSLYRNNRLLVLDKGFESQKLTYLPLFYFQNFKEDKQEVTKVAIPGAVSQKRRDYNHILNEISQLKNHQYLEFIFLGKAEGQELELLKTTENQLPETISFKYFKEKVPQKLFDEEMKSASFLWCPIQKETEFFSIKEVYGKTKMTGNIGDAIKYGKLAVFPLDYPSEYPFIINEKVGFLNSLEDINSVFSFENQFNKDKIQRELENVLGALIFCKSSKT